MNDTKQKDQTSFLLWLSATQSLGALSGLAQASPGLLTCCLFKATNGSNQQHEQNVTLSLPSRTEAANSVLRRTASRERAYVLSAAKKSNG